MSRMTAMETSWKHGQRPLTSLSPTMQNCRSLLTVLDGKEDTTLKWHLLALGSLQCAGDEYETPSNVHNTVLSRSLSHRQSLPNIALLEDASTWWKLTGPSLAMKLIKPLQISAHTNHYSDLVDLVKKAAWHNIPRGCQKEDIPAMSDESSDLLKIYDEKYHKDPFSESTIQIGDTLLDEISDEIRNIWRDMVENTNLAMNSKKAWFKSYISVVWGRQCLPSSRHCRLNR